LKNTGEIWKISCLVEDLKVNITTYKNLNKKAKAFFSAQKLIFIILLLEHKYQYDTMGFNPTDEIVKRL